MVNDLDIEHLNIRICENGISIYENQIRKSRKNRQWVFTDIDDMAKWLKSVYNSTLLKRNKEKENEENSRRTVDAGGTDDLAF